MLFNVGFAPGNFAAKRRKTPSLEGKNQWLARPKYFGISGPFCSPTGSNPVGDATGRVLVTTCKT
jgi:hypothetical protein